MTRRERIPVTTPRRTIEDLKQTLEPHLVRRAKRLKSDFLSFIWPDQMLAVETDFFVADLGEVPKRRLIATRV